MTFPVTEEGIKAVYIMLCDMPPFSRWHLPPASMLKFSVTDHNSRFGDYSSESKTIRVSSNRVRSFNGLLMTVAHEIIHVHQDFSGKWPKGNPHNKAFQKKAHQICDTFHFDTGSF